MNFRILYIKEGQYSPMHFHWSKMEDIINRGGGNVLIRVYNSTPDEELDKESEVHVHVDGREMVVPAGSQVRLTPGESITIYPYLYHDFEVEPGSGPVLLGEVSQCNDDNTDNRFYEKLGRFPAIEEARHTTTMQYYRDLKKKNETLETETRLLQEKKPRRIIIVR